MIELHEGRVTGVDFVRALGEDDLPEIVEVITDAFQDYPVIRFVLGDSPGYEERARELVEFFVRARLLKSEPLLGLHSNGRIDGVALVSFPMNPAAELKDLRERLWKRLGLEERARYEAFSHAAGESIVDVPRVHLNMLAVRRPLQSRGLGRRLIEAVHQIAVAVPDSQGVSLTTEDPANIPLYRHLGYRLTGEARISPELHSWAFFRPNPGADQT